VEETDAEHVVDCTETDFLSRLTETSERL